MGFLLNLPPLAPPDAALSAFYIRLSTEYAMLRTSYRESLSEALIIKLCDRLATTFNCKKQGFRKVSTNTEIKYAGSNGALLSIVISPDGYGSGTAQSRACPSCGQIYNGKTKLGGLGWTNAHNIINHGRIGTALGVALDDSLKRSGTSDPRLASAAADIKAVIDFLKGRAEGYGGPAVTFGAGEQCPICEKIHASDCLIQRHHRCKLHVQAGNTYRSIKIDGTDYVRGNEAIVGIQFGATRARPEGDLPHLAAFTSSMAGKIAGEVVSSLGELYDKQDLKYNQALVMDLLLLQDKLTWAVRKRLIEAASGPLSALPADRAQVVLLNPVVPVATAFPALPPPTVDAYSVPPAPPMVDAAPPPIPVSVVGPIGVVPDPPAPPPGPVERAPVSTWPLYIGSLKQRLLRSPYPDAGVVRMQRAPGYRPDLVQKLAEYPDAREKLYYMLDQFWIAFKQNKLAEPVFHQLVREFALIGFDKVPGAKVAGLKLELGLR